MNPISDIIDGNLAMTTFNRLERFLPDLQNYQVVIDGPPTNNLRPSYPSHFRQSMGRIILLHNKFIGHPTAGLFPVLGMRNGSLATMALSMGMRPDRREWSS